MQLFENKNSRDYRGEPGLWGKTVVHRLLKKRIGLPQEDKLSFHVMKQSSIT